jgi:hypothetical protein
MPGRNADLIRGVYGVNWAAVVGRGRGLAAAREVMAPDVQAQISSNMPLTAPFGRLWTLRDGKADSVEARLG